MTSVWDNPDLKVVGDFVSFDEPGDEVVGEITGIRVYEWPDGKKSPQLFIRKDDGDEVCMTVGQMQLKAKLHDARPEIGDRIKVVFTRTEKRDGGKTLKHFDVTVKRGEPKPSADDF